MSITAGTVVITTANCEVILDLRGFYVRCLSPNCTYVSEYTPAKPVARRLAEAHDNDESDADDEQDTSATEYYRCSCGADVVESEQLAHEDHCPGYPVASFTGIENAPKS